MNVPLTRVLTVNVSMDVMNIPAIVTRGGPVSTVKQVNCNIIICV